MSREGKYVIFQRKGIWAFSFWATEQIAAAQKGAKFYFDTYHEAINYLNNKILK